MSFSEQSDSDVIASESNLSRSSIKFGNAKGAQLIRGPISMPSSSQQQSI